MKIKFNNEKCDSWNEYARFEKSLKATTRILIADMSALTVLVSDLGSYPAAAMKLIGFVK